MSSPPPAPRPPRQDTPPPTRSIPGTPPPDQARSVSHDDEKVAVGVRFANRVLGGIGGECP